MADAWTILKILTWTKDYLFSKGINNARLEAEWLLCAATGLDRVGLYIQYDKPLNDSELAVYRAMVSRRARREPLQHILGSQEFYGLDFEVTADVLIPRHDTEILISEATTRHPNAFSVLDIGTGSGCIAVTLQKQLSHALVTATDVSDAALTIARRNADKHGAPVEFLLGSMFTPVAGRCFDLIVSNPPYIPTSVIDGLEQEVRDYDPISALDGGADGLVFYRILIPESVKYLKPGGWFIVEVGIDQAIVVEELLRQTCSYGEAVVALDSSGIERVVSAQRKEIL